MKLYKIYKQDELLGTYLAETEHQAINKALSEHGGNIAEFHAEKTNF